MLVYSPIITERLRYITRFLGNEIEAKPFELTDDTELFRRANGPRLNYSSQSLTDNEIWIKPYTILLEQKIVEQNLIISDWNGLPVIFQTGGTLSFDLLAASFYLITRYEEYLPHTKDMYGRYAHENSVAFKNGFLDRPLINEWIANFRELVFQRFPGTMFPEKNFVFIPSYDIDEAWSYKHKSTFRSTGAAIKNIFQGNWSAIRKRNKVRKGKEQDPFDVYDWMDQLHYKHQLDPRYFFLVAEKNGRYDKNILPGKPALQQLIRKHSKKYSIGVHPSWQSGDSPDLIKKEKEKIEMLIEKKINSSRQHFIRMSLPQTYRQLINAGIEEDFSMGYGSINGFRASVASVFSWYDLEEEKETSLRLFPFCFMDANSFFEQHQNPDEALEEIQRYYATVKKLNGCFIPIWHNTFLGTDELFKGWRNCYEDFIQSIS